MTSSGLFLIRTDEQKRQLRLLHRRQMEQQLYREYEAAGEDLERVIESHAPGQVERAVDVYVEATAKLQRYLISTESHLSEGPALKRRQGGCHY